MAHGMKRARLSGIEVLDGYRLRLAFVDGCVSVVDFNPLFDESPGLARLRDPAVFATATLVEGEGWAVEWPALDLQIGADTLWLDVQARYRLKPAAASPSTPAPPPSPPPAPATPHSAKPTPASSPATPTRTS